MVKGQNPNDEARQKLFAIRKNWAKNLPSKLDEIQAAWQSLTEGPWDGERLRELHRMTHTIAGSGGTFGLPAIGLAAREAEILLKALQQEGGAPSDDMRQPIAEKLDHLRRVCDQALQSGVPEPPRDPLAPIRRPQEKEEAEQVIYLVEDDEDLATELKRQLELYRYSVETFGSLEAFRQAFQEKEPAIVIMDIELPDGKGTDFLQEMGRERGASLNTIFITVHDDIHNRLNAIRAGGETFLHKPLDVPQMVERLGSYLKNEDSEPFRVLIVDDSLSLSSHYAMLLREADMETAVVNDPLKTFGALADFLPDLVLMDLYMPECSGQELAQLIRQREAYVSIPIVFLSSETDPESQLKAMNLGGDDFLNKSMESAHLVEAVKHRAKRSRQIRSFLTRDELTGLPNRNALKDRLRQAIRQTQRGETKMGFAIIDLDLFKKVNDSLGHLFGDKVLQEAARRIKSALRPGDTVCRLGGDEFAVIFLGVTSNKDAGYAASRIEDALSQTIAIDRHTVHMSASVGLTIFPDDTLDIDTLIKNADLALNAAKSSGRGTHRFFMRAMGSIADRRLSLENDMRTGLERGDFVLHYQPKIELPDRKVTGMESLVRWEHPEKGMISPGEFIPLAEETGLIIPLGELILRQACQDAKAWLDEGYDLRVAVNLSSRQFQHPDLVGLVESILNESGLPSGNLELEITESMVMGNMEQVIDLLQAFRDRGIHISVDDFGTGYSSLSYLKRFPIHALKIDQSFIREMHQDEDDSSIVKAIISMGRNLRLNIIAEGVEQIEHLEMLEVLGCHVIQGYFFSKPLPKEAFSAFLKDPSNH